MLWFLKIVTVSLSGKIHAIKNYSHLTLFYSFVFIFYFRATSNIRLDLPADGLIT